MGTRWLGIQLSHPAPGGYEYGGLALQVWSSATGRLTTCHRKKANFWGTEIVASVQSD